MAKLIVKLKQHTPLLHFQHRQQGATLRATEVKPKLDRFIRMIYEQNSPKKELKPNWLIKEGASALDYKMLISLESEERKEYWVTHQTSQKQRTPNYLTLIRKSPYFAQMEDDDKLKKCFDKQQFGVQKWNEIGKKGLTWSMPVKITFFSLHADLLKVIEKYIEDFFICTNFGARSDKGFGCFTVISDDKLPLEEKVDNTLRKYFEFAYKRSEPIEKNDERMNVIFRIITDDFSKIRKYMETYVQKNKFGRSLEWDRSYFKKIVKGDSADAKDYVYVRGLLGLPSLYSYSKLPGEPTVRITVNSASSDQIERFPSPILFKVIGDSIYIVGNTCDVNCMFDKTIKVDCSTSESNKTSYLQTPKTFDLKDYIKCAISGKQLNYKRITEKNQNNQYHK